MQIWPSPILGKRGCARSPDRLMKREGIRTLVRKFRLCQSVPGRRPTLVEASSGAPFLDLWRTTLLRLFFENGIGTIGERYKLRGLNQNLSRYDRFYRHDGNNFAQARYARRNDG